MTLVQMPCVEGDRKKNFGKARLLLKKYRPGKGVQFIQFPELFAIGFRHEDYQSQGPGVLGPTSDFLVSIAEEYGALTIGTGIEKSDDKFYNTLALAKPSGKIAGMYRKIHPFQEERDVFKGVDFFSSFCCSPSFIDNIRNKECIDIHKV